MIRLLALLGILVPSALPRPARADDREAPRSVVIVFEPGATAISRRLRQEVEALGFEVLLRKETEPKLSLEALAVQLQAVAAIRVEPFGDAGAEPGVELNIVDRATGKTVHRELTRVNARDPESEELVATRTVELLRASLMEVDADHPSRGAIQPSHTVRALVQHDEASRMRKDYGVLLLSTGPAVSLMPSFRPSAQLWLEASWMSRVGVGVSAGLLVPLSAAKLGADEGSVDVQATSYRLGAAWDGVTNEARVSARLSAGWSLTTLSLRGRAASPYVGLRTDRVAWGPWLAAAGRARLSDHLGALAQAGLAYALPNQTIRFADREVGSVSKPSCQLGVAMELEWP